MGLFGKDKKVDTSQDKQIAQLQRDIKNCWDWIQTHEKNMAILIKNNNNFIEKHKQFTTTIQTLQNHISTLEAEAQANKQRDTELAKKFQALGASFATESEVHTEG